MDIEYFANDKYRVLLCMAKSQILVNEISLITLSQQEIAEILQLSKVKVNAIISDLKADAYLTQLSPRGKYVITDKANMVLQKLNDGEEK